MEYCRASLLHMKELGVMMNHWWRVMFSESGLKWSMDWTPVSMTGGFFFSFKPSPAQGGLVVTGESRDQVGRWGTYEK